MTVLLGEVWRLLAGSAVWLAAVAAAALGVALIGRRESSALPALAGALVAAGLATRFDLAGGGGRVAGRPFPIAWIVAGAVAGVVVNEVVRRRSSAG